MDAEHFTGFDAELTPERAVRLRARLLSGEHRPVQPQDRDPMIAWCDEVLARADTPSTREGQP